MILSDQEIKAAMRHGLIVIEPFDPKAVGGNSYDVHLSPHLKTYVALDFSHEGAVFDAGLDCAREHETFDITIPDGGYVLMPGVLYLGSTIEYTETHQHVPYLDGKSSIGRLGINIHATAGRGDVGFCNHWTLELSVIHPVRVYAGMPVGQLTYHLVFGDVSENYRNKKTSAYAGLSCDPKPVASRMFKNFDNDFNVGGPTED